MLYVFASLRLISAEVVPKFYFSLIFFFPSSFKL